MKVLLITNDGGGFADHVEVADGTTVARPPQRRWHWRAVVAAGLHGAAWWLRHHAPGPLVAAAAAVVGATLLLLH
jgi:hypothetical protein